MLRNVPTLYNRIYDWEPFVCNSIWLFIGTGECDGNSAVIKIIGTRDRAPASHFCYPPDNKRFHPSARIKPPHFSRKIPSPLSSSPPFSTSGQNQTTDLEILRILTMKTSFRVHKRVSGIRSMKNQFNLYRIFWKMLSKIYSLRSDGSNIGWIEILCCRSNTSFWSWWIIPSKLCDLLSCVIARYRRKLKGSGVIEEWILENGDKSGFNAKKK